MVEYYGWINIRVSYKLEEASLDEDIQLSKMVRELKRKILKTQSQAQVEFVNGAALLHCEGYTNHWGKEIDDV